MLALVEQTAFNKLIKSNQARLSPLGRVQFLYSMLGQAIAHKKRDGYAWFAPNLGAAAGAAAGAATTAVGATGAGCA